MTELWRKPAREIVHLLRGRQISPLDVIDDALARIEDVNPAVNAVVTLAPERARLKAREMGEQSERGLLAGLPVLIKDLVEVAGMRTTYGSTVFADNVPATSAIPVDRLERNGGIVLGKTNTPEFGAGAQTFNEVFGVTRNPWDTRLTCAGSSGGAAVALATGMAWLADGSDLGGSLRTPAAFCSIVGLRPSPGRVPHGPSSLPFDTLAVEGPMARDVRDVALMLDAMAGFEAADPLSYDPPAASFVDAVERQVMLGRVAFSPDLGGITPVDPEVAAICRAAAGRLSEVGAEVDEASPDLASATEVFTVLRAARFAAARGPLLPQHRAALKPEVVWNIEAGLALTADRIGWAERERAGLFQRTHAFLQRYDLLLCPAAIVPPFPVEQRYVGELQGHTFPSYIDWVSITYALTLTGCPVLSLPCGFTATGLPVGLQIVARPRDEPRLLAAGAQLESLLGIAGRVPMDPVVRH